MYHRIIILALLFLASEKTSSQYFNRMQFSDALPVQFWPIACSTYNEHEAQGVFHKCFCAPWECGDEIKVQFTDAPSQDFSLLIFDSEGNELDSIIIDEVSSGVYQIAFTPNENSPGFCETIQLKIQSNAGTEAVSLPALSTWLTSSLSGSDPDWTLGAAPTVNLPGAGFGGISDSEFLYTDFAFIPGATYTITVNHTRTVLFRE